MMKKFDVGEQTFEQLFPQINAYILESLGQLKLSRKATNRALLMTEESLVQLSRHGAFEKAGREPAMRGGTIQVNVRRLFGDVTIDLTAPGEEFPFASGLDLGVSLDNEEAITPKTAEAIENILLRSFEDDVQYRHQPGRKRPGFNSVRIWAARSRHKLLYETLSAFVLAIILSVILRNFVPDGFIAALNDNLLVPGKTMFLNALKMIVAPVVFFSIVSCIAQFDNFSEMGRIGVKVVAFYFLATFVAIAIGIGVFDLLSPLSAASIPLPSSGAQAAASQASVSLKSVIVGAVPSNFLKPFIEMNMIQIIFMAVLCGTAAGVCGEHAKRIRAFFDAGNTLFLKTTNMLIKFVPLGTFCSIMSLCLTTGLTTILSLVGMVVIFAAGMLCMAAFYCLVILLLNRLNPLKFISKYMPSALQCFSMASSNASIPVNMEACEKLGIPRRVYSLCIPLGATINMHGTCIYLAVFSLALAKLYGVTVSASTIASMFLSIFVLSVGSPGVTGAGLVCLSMLLEQIGGPIEAVAIVMGIDPLLAMMRTMGNCMGDVAGGLIVSGSEGLLDRSVYNGKTN